MEYSRWNANWGQRNTGNFCFELNQFLASRNIAVDVDTAEGATAFTEESPTPSITSMLSTFQFVNFSTPISYIDIMHSFLFHKAFESCWGEENKKKYMELVAALS